jgi:hypothetical protein
MSTWIQGSDQGGIRVRVGVVDIDEILYKDESRGLSGF